MVDSKNTALYKFKNQTGIQNDPKTYTVIEIAEKHLLPIDPEIVQKLGIRDGDIVSQIEDGAGTIKLIFKDTKNGSRPQVSQQADDQDYGE